MLRADELHELLELGSSAPSGGNVQPWRARVTATSLELFLDPARSNSFIDVHRSASLLALGAFTENVAIAARHLGLVHDIAVEDAEDPTRLVVRFSFGGRTAPKEADPLYPCIRTRCTNRHPHRGHPIPPQRVEELAAAVSSFGGGCRAFFVGTEAKLRAAAVVLGRADRLRMVNQALHAQLFSELRWTRETVGSSRDGIDTRTLELSAPALLALRLMRSYAFVRRLLPKAFLEFASQSSLVQSSHLCVLAMPEPPASGRHPAFVGAGRVLERMWLLAERHHLAVQPWAVLPFFWFRAVYENGAGFSASEKELVLSLGRELRAIFGVPAPLVPFFILRLSNAAPPSERALRLDWRSFTEIVEEPGKAEDTTAP